MKHPHPTFTMILTSATARDKLNWGQFSIRAQGVLEDMMGCHTEVSGFSKSVCDCCGHVDIHYGSCNNSACPQCGAHKRKRWVAKMESKVVNAPYYHIIFTVCDHFLNPLFREDPEFMYNCLFKAQAATLKEFCADSKYLGVVNPGFFSALHTFGADLKLHPHIHTLLAACGFDKDGNFVCGKENFLFPAKNLAKVFKGKFLDLVKAKYKGTRWNHTLHEAKADRKWNVEIRSAGLDPEYAVRYLGRYINRVGISNGRLVAYDEKSGTVKFRYKDYRHNGELRIKTMDEVEFIRRFTLHILPTRFQRIRYYGFLSNNSLASLQKVQECSGAKIYNPSGPIEAADPEEVKEEAEDFLEVEDVRKVCPKCKGTSFTCTSRPRAIHRWQKRAVLRKVVEDYRAKVILSG